MKLIAFSLFILSSNIPSSIHSADISESTTFVGWNFLPKELQDIIVYEISTPKDNPLQPEAYTACHNVYATLQKLTLTQKSDSEWSKDTSNWIKERCIQSYDPVLMSVCGCDHEAILSRYIGMGERHDYCQIKTLRSKVLDHLRDLLLLLEKPLARKTFLNFLNRSGLIPANNPRTLIPDITFIQNHYSPLMTLLIKNKEYNLLSDLTSCKWPLIIGDEVPPDHVKLLVEQSKTNLPQLRKIRDMVHKAYRHEIYSTGTYYYWMQLHAPENEACSIV